MNTKQELREAYDTSTQPEHRIVDEDGANMANATLRQTDLGWVYQDDVDGFELLSAEDAERLLR